MSESRHVAAGLAVALRLHSRGWPSGPMGAVGMMALAERITGQKFQPREYAKAADAIEKWIAAQPYEDVRPSEADEKIRADALRQP